MTILVLRRSRVKYNKAMIKFLLILLLSIQVNALKIPNPTLSASLQEQKRGNEFLQIIWDTGLIIADIEAQVYLKTLGYELAEYSENPKKHFGFFLLDDSSINAFAGAYGYIGVHTGMLLSSESEAELAGVLSHEIAHVTQNHLLRFDDKTSNQTYIMLAGMLAAALTGNSNASQAIVSSTLAATAQQSINFTREHEWEADRAGTNALIKSGFDPEGLGHFFEKLKDSANAQEFLRSHPLSINRIADSMQRASRIDGVYRQDSFAYKTIKARLYYLKNGRIKFEQDQNQEQDLALYMQAYNAFESQNYPVAEEFVAQLLVLNSSASSYLLAGRIYAKLGKIEKAQQYFSKISKNEAAIYYEAQAYLDNNQVQKAVSLLKRYLRRNQGDYLSHKLLSAVYVDAGSIDRAHIENAKALIRQGKLESAIAQYQRAQAVTHSQDLFDIISVNIERLEDKIDLYKQLL